MELLIALKGRNQGMDVHECEASRFLEGRSEPWVALFQNAGEKSNQNEGISCQRLLCQVQMNSSAIY